MGLILNGHSLPSLGDKQGKVAMEAFSYIIREVG